MENKENLQEESIDLGKLVNIVMEHKKQIGAIIISCTTLAVVMSFILPKQWESTTLVQLRSASGGSDASAMASFMGISLGGSSSASPTNYIALMKSRTVLQPIIDQMEWEDEKKKPDPEGFAKKYLEIQNAKQTNLITVKAKGSSPEEAQMISQAVVDNFLTMQTNMNQQTQSAMVKFLNDRIDEAKKDAEDARAKFAEYQQNHKVYSPDEQAKAAVDKMNTFDEAIGNMVVQQKAGRAKLEAVSSKLGDIRSSSQSLNINDNANVMTLRKQIVEAQVDLVGLQERYTEGHPGVISAKEKIAALQKKLSEEVNTIVASKYTTMNPTQAALIGEQANAQVSIAVAQASEEAIQQRKAEKEKELENFPKEVLEYLKLQRDSAIKEDIYTGLVKQCENRKIQEVMESMDIQIVDPANLPDEDNYKIARFDLVLVILSFIGGCMIVGVLINTYKKEMDW